MKKSIMTMLMDLTTFSAIIPFLVLIFILSCNQAEINISISEESTQGIKSLDTSIYLLKNGKHTRYDTLFSNKIDSNTLNDVLCHFFNIKNPNSSLNSFLSDATELSDSLSYVYSVNSPYICMYEYTSLGPIYVNAVELPSCDYSLIYNSKYSTNYVDSVVTLAKNYHKQRSIEIFKNSIRNVNNDTNSNNKSLRRYDSSHDDVRGN